MKRVWLWAAAPLLAFAAAGCTPQVGSSAYPCENCNYGYVQAKKSSERKVWCVIDGKTVDCQKDPAACPGCKKAHGQ
jgi:hypothetical protein